MKNRIRAVVAVIGTVAMIPAIYRETNRTPEVHTGRSAVIPAVMASCSTVRNICRELVERAKTVQAEGEYAAAEGFVQTGVHLGQLLNRDPEGMLIVQLVGIAAGKLTLVELKSLCEQMNASEKLIATGRKIRQGDADHRALVARTRGSYPQPFGESSRPGTRALPAQRAGLGRGRSPAHTANGPQWA